MGWKVEIVLRLGLVGAGAIGAAHARAAQHVSGVTVSAVCDVNGDVATAVGLEHEAKSFNDHRDLFDSGLTDAIVVSTPHALHRDIVVDAALAGQHVLVEKPMATSVEDCTAMLKACERAGVQLAVGHLQRFEPRIALAKNIIAQGEIGMVQAILDHRHVLYVRSDRPSWFFSKELAGGGVLFNIGAHSIDRSVWLAERQISSVDAHVLRRDGTNIETDAFLTVNFDGGAISRISVTGAGEPRRDEITVVGETGSVTITRPQVVLRHNDGAAMKYEPQRETEPALVAQLRHFRDAAEGDWAPAVDGVQGRHVVAAIIAGYQSADTGERQLLT